MKCATCKYSLEERQPDNPLMKQLFCALHPPQIVVIPIQTPQGVGMNMTSMRPPVGPDVYCFQWEAKPDAANDA